MQTNQTHPGDNITQEQANHSLPFSTLKPKYSHAFTPRFGLYTPHFVMETVPNDSPIILRNATELRTMSLKTPQFSSLSMKKDYFNVPMQAIYPNSFEKFYTNPLFGDDVPEDVCGSVDNFGNILADFMTVMQRSILNSFDSDGFMTNTMEDVVAHIFRFLSFGDMFYGTGSLLSDMRYKCYQFFKFQNAYLDTDQTVKYHVMNMDGTPVKWNTFGKLLDFWLNRLVAEVSVTTEYDRTSLSSSFVAHFMDLEDNPTDSVRVAIAPYILSEDSGVLPGNMRVIGLRTFLQMVKESPRFRIEVLRGDSRNLFSNAWFTGSSESMSDIISALNYVSYESHTRAVDISRFWAYQLICAHYYTNDSVDSIYSATLFRELVSYHVDKALGDFEQYSYNGIKIPYDYLSAHYFNSILTAAINGENYQLALPYLSLLFCHQRSLRYVDYFTGGKTFPYAVGDLDVAVNGSNVSIIDVTKKIQYQRFLNACQRIGSKISNYILGIFGKAVSYDFHDPAFLAHTSDVIFSKETQNTGDAQQSNANSITSTLHSVPSDKYSFEFYSDRPSILVGITYFDIPRYYQFATDRQFFHRNRFDMFNPFFQYVGDQEIYREEFDGRNPANDIPFGYTMRNMEYKLRMDDVSGGFVDDLKGYIFKADNVDSGGYAPTISPDYIRSVITELDDFYVVLNGYSNGSAYHFQMVSNNFVTAHRPMAYSPQILKA